MTVAWSRPVDVSQTMAWPYGHRLWYGPPAAVSSTGDSDEQLIERANGGDPAAFEALYRRYRDWVTALAFRFTANRDDALDVLQETFAYFFGKFPNFQLTSSMKTFLYPVVKHNALRRRQSARGVEDIDDLHDVLPAPESSGSTSDLLRRLNHLTPQQREIVWLRFAEDLSLPQIAEALAIPVGTVKSRLHNALQALRRAEAGRD